GALVLNGSNSLSGVTLTVFQGMLQANSPAALSSQNVTINSGTLSLASDGTLISTGINSSVSIPESILFNDPVTMGSNAAITVGRSGTMFAPLFTLAVNKTEQIPSLTGSGFTVTV